MLHEISHGKLDYTTKAHYSSALFSNYDNGRRNVDLLTMTVDHLVLEMVPMHSTCRRNFDKSFMRTLYNNAVVIGNITF